LVAPIVSNPRLTRVGWTHVFRFTNSDDETGRAIAAHMRDALDKRRVALVASDTVYGRSMAEAFAAGFEAVGGTVGPKHVVAEGTRDFAALVAALPRDIDAVFYGGTFEGAPLLIALRAAGRNALFATGDGCWDVGNLLEPAGEAATAGEGVLVLSACPELGVVEGAREFAARYARRFGAIRNYAVNAYDSAMLVLAAIRKARHPVNRHEVLAALCATEHRGIAYPDPIRWDRRGENRAAVTALHVIRDGRFHQVALIKKAA
jgi:branched-chain amino acid transport system substrate-binding protein